MPYEQHGGNLLLDSTEAFLTPNAELENWIPSVLRYGTISEAISSGSLQDFLLFSLCNEDHSRIAELF